MPFYLLAGKYDPTKSITRMGKMRAEHDDSIRAKTEQTMRLGIKNCHLESDV